MIPTTQKARLTHMAGAFGRVGGGQATYTLFQGLFVLASVRYLAPAALAEYSIAIAMFTVVSGLTTSALRRAYILDFEALGLAEAQGHFVVTQVVLLTLGLLLVGCIAGASVEVSAALCALIIANTLFENARFYLQKHEDYRGFAVLTATQPVFGLAGLLALLMLQHSGIALAAAGWSVVLSQALSRVVVLFLTRNQLSSLFRGVENFRGAWIVASHLFIHRYYILSLHYGAIGWLLTSGLFFLDMRGETLEAAAYGATQRYYGILVGLVITAQSVLLPALSKAETLSDMRSIFRNYYIICIPLTAIVGLLALVAPVWIPVIDGGRYPSSILGFQILSAMIVVSLWTSVHSTVLTKAKQYVALVAYALVGCGVTFALAFMSPFGGVIGVAIATAVGFSVCCMAVAVHSWWMIGRDAPPTEYRRRDG
jgi:O-antigen/teichoic acid export membrane protein